MVLRTGDTVLRHSQSWSDDVQRLLTHVRRRGFQFAPEPLGSDDQGRDVVRYIEGDTSATVTPWPGTLWSDQLLVEVGKTVAEYHRAVADFVPPDVVHWQFRPRALAPGEIICHHDFAPYNAVFRGHQLLGMIDWESAGPGTIQGEIAFLAWQWVPLSAPERRVNIGNDPNVDPVTRLRLLVDSYGFEDRMGLIQAIIERVEISRSGIEARATEGARAYIELRDEGHTRDMASLIRHLETNQRKLQSAIE